MSEVEHGTRLTRVESEVSGIKNDVTDLKAQMRGFGNILQRIESGISTAQKQAVEDKNASRLNPIAVSAILITIITTLVGGSWLVSGELSRTDMRMTDQQTAATQLMLTRDREIDSMLHRIDRIEDRGDSRGSTQRQGPSAPDNG